MFEFPKLSVLAHARHQFWRHHRSFCSAFLLASPLLSWLKPMPFFVFLLWSLQSLLIQSIQIRMTLLPESCSDFATSLASVSSALAESYTRGHLASTYTLRSREQLHRCRLGHSFGRLQPFSRRSLFTAQTNHGLVFVYPYHWAVTARSWWSRARRVWHEGSLA